MYVFIINPIAGNGRSKRIFSKIKRSELYQRIESINYFTDYSGHAEEIMEQIKDKDITCVIVIGGDGTVHEVVNGMSSLYIPLAFIPAGSGNDFARGCNIKGDSLTIFEQIIKGNNRIPYWIGRYQIDNVKRCFVNSIGFGFDAEIADVANKSRYKKFFNKFRLGTLSYCFALVHVLLYFKPMTMELEINGEKRHMKNCWMMTIANHPFYGGGMKIIPHAKIQANTFPVLLIHSISKWKVLAFFMTVFTGKHVNFKEVELVEASQIKMSSNKKVSFQVDGQTSTSTTCIITKSRHRMSVNGFPVNVKREQTNISLK
ncbi:diacylglycerol/lipid kinase family protein [Virgibacillus ndiopensis]|uniref:diacylglycerol/lipid kinase family protein n=1 Tax=Virgibacillus ndiopensis TaxID=2004408 RepID=UPI00159BBABF|nr:diacylglycerol kinase family protein [Virgibacillus ndiopensis]